MKRWSLVLAVAASFTAPLLAQSISAELPVSAPRLTNMADHEQSSPAVATDGNMFLVAWQNRTASGEIQAARVSRDGALLDETPIPVAVAPRRGERPQVAWTGELFIVLWRNVAEIRATKISPGGEIVGEESIGSGLGPSMSCTTTRCLVTWSIGAGPGMSRVAARFLDSRGTPLPELAVLPTFTGGIAWSAPSATNGSNFLVTWQQFNAGASPRVKLYTAAVSLSGAVTNVQLIATEDFALKQHAVASDGATYFVTWALSDGALNRIEGQRLDGDGKLSGAPKVLDLSGPVGGLMNLVRITRGYLVFMNRHYGPEGLFAFRVGVDGSVLDRTPALLTDSFRFNDGIGAAANGSKALVVWPRVTGAAAQPDIYAAFVDSESGTMQQPFLVSRSAAPQVSPALATDGERIVTAWSEESPAPSQIRIAALLPNGLRSEARAIHPSALHQIQPGIAFNGLQYLVVWGEADRSAGIISLMAKRLNRFGEPIEHSAIVLSSSGCALLGEKAVVASDGRDFVVAWRECQSPSRRLYATQISDGAAGEPRLVAESANPFDMGGIAWGGEHYLLTWLDLKPVPGICDGYCKVPQVLATRLSRAAQGLDVQPLQLSPVGAFPTFSRVAWNGAQFAAFWWEDRDIYAVRVSPSGNVAAPVIVVRMQRRAAALAAAFDGAAAALTWTDQGTSGFGDIWMARVAFDGGSSSPTFQVTSSADDELAPAVAALAPGTFAVGYQRVAHEREYGSANRVFVRMVQFTPRRRAAGRQPN